MLALLALWGCTHDHLVVDRSGASLALSAGSIDFGAVPMGAPSTVSLGVANRGNLPLEFHVELKADPTRFSASSYDAHSLAAGESTSIDVTFDSSSPGDASGVLALYSNDPVNPEIWVPLSGSSYRSPVTFDPPALDFGDVRPECGAAEGVTLRNGGDEPVVIGRIAADDAAFDARPADESAGGGPWTVPAGGELPLTVSFAPTDLGEYYGYLVASDEGGAPLAGAGLAALAGEGTTVTDDFVVDGGAVDVILPIQRYEDMTDVDTFYDGFGPFLDELADHGVEYQIAIVQDDSGCAYGSDPYLTWKMPRQQQMDIAYEQIYGENPSMVPSHGLVVAQHAADRIGAGECNEGLVRDDAKLAVFGYTFVGYNHPDAGWMSVVYPVLKVKPDPADVTYYGIVEDLYNGCGWGSHSFWSDAIDYTGGEWYSICGDIEGDMLLIADLLASPQQTFPLSKVPDPATITVTSGDETVSAWTYSSKSNSVTLTDATQFGVDVRITYQLAVGCP